MRRWYYLPNLLSSLRITLAPAMLGAAYSNAKVGFPVLLGVALATDLIDGVLARRWRVESALGRRLDRWGDGLTTTLGAAGVFFLWPDVIEREWPWALLALAGCAMVGVRWWLQPASTRSVPRWPMKLAGLAVPVSLIPLITGWTPWAFQGAAVLQFLIGGWKLFGRAGRGGKAGAAEPATRGVRA